MYNILNSYIRKRIILSIAIVLLVLIFLSSLIRLVDELRKIGEGNYSVLKIFIYVIASLPKDFELFFPVATLLGGLLGLSVFEVHNEFMAMQVFGFGKSQITWSVIKSVIPVLLCSIIFNEWIVPNSEKMMCAYRKQLQHDTYLFAIDIKNLWFRDNNSFVCVKHVVSYDELLGVYLFTFNKEKKIRKISYIERAVFVQQFWRLINVNELCIFSDMQVISRRIPYSEWHAELTPDRLSMMITNSNMLSISQLYHCIKYFNKIDQNSKYYQMLFWNRILSPISGLAMIIMALSCTFGPLYQKKISIRLCIGSFIGFLFYILNQVCGILSVAYGIPVIIGSMLPSVIFIIISIIIVWKYS